MTDNTETHRKKMKQVKADHLARVKQNKKADRGLLMINTGDGKGKSTAAFGTALRAIGWGHAVAIVQYVKGTWKTGEKEFFTFNPDLLRLEVMGQGFTWETQDKQRDIKAATKAWELSCEIMNSGDYDLVILDELNIVLRDNYLDVEKVRDALLARHPRTTVIITGRNAPDSLIEVADMVTSMEKVKHPFDAGIKAARGIDF